MCVKNIAPSNIVLTGAVVLFTTQLYRFTCIRSSIIKTAIVIAVPLYYIAKSIGKFSDLDYNLCGLIGFLDVMVPPISSIVLLVKLIHEREVHTETSYNEKRVE